MKRERNRRIIPIILIIGVVFLFFISTSTVFGQSAQESKCSSYDSLLDEGEDDVITLTTKIIEISESSCPQQKSVLDNQLRTLLKNRKQLLLQAIKEAPEKALLTPELPKTITAKLSTIEQEQLLEKRGEFEGPIETWHVDDFEDPENSYFRFYLFIDNKKYQLFSSPELPVLQSGTPIKVKGIALDDALVVVAFSSIISDSNSFSQLKTKINIQDSTTLPYKKQDEKTLAPLGGAGSPDENHGEQKTLVIVANIGTQQAPATVEQAKQLIFGDAEGTVQDYYKKNSYNKAFLTGDVVGTYTLVDGSSSTALAAAQTDVQKLGKKLADYDRLILIIPCKSQGCPAGSGTIGKTIVSLPTGETVYMSISQDHYAELYVVGHELGHNFGVHHASRYKCFTTDGSQKSFSYDCTHSEYGDPFSIMGYSTGHHTAQHKKEISWLSGENILTVTEGTYTLVPQEILLSPGKIQMIRIPITMDTNFYGPSPNLYHTIEFRQPLDYDRGFDPGLYSGVSIRVALGYIQTSLISLDATGDFKNWLAPGKSFIDDINGYKITLDSITGTGADATAQITVTQIPKQEPPNLANPLIHYDFEEKLAVGSRVKDKAGYVRGGIVYRKDSTMPINTAGGIIFHEKGDYEEYGEYIPNDYIELPEFPNTFIRQNSQFTVSAWINAFNFPKYSALIYGLSYPRTLKLGPDGKVALEASFIGPTTYYPTLAILESDAPLQIGKWYHIGAVYNSNELKLYINGVEKKISSITENGKIIPLTKLYPVYSSNNLNFLGGTKTGGGFNGIIDEFKVYARGLSPAEIQDVYQSYTPQPVCIDGDGDGYGTGDLSACAFTTIADCNDNDLAVTPGKIEVCGDGKDNNCKAEDDICNNEIIIDNNKPGFSKIGTWIKSGITGSYGVDSIYSKTIGDTATWQFINLDPGTYEVFAWWTVSSGRSTSVPYTISYQGASQTVRVNQRDLKFFPGKNWYSLGKYDFGVLGRVMVKVENTYSHNADAVRLVRVKYCPDEDGDGYGYGKEDLSGCVSPQYDCSPIDPEINPGATEICGDGIDNNCDGKVLEPSTEGGTKVIILDNAATNTPTFSKSGSWFLSSATGSYVTQSIYSKTAGSTATWTTPLTAGKYDVYAWWTEWSSRPTAAPYTIIHATGVATVTKNQKEAGSGAKWNLLGTYDFTTTGKVVLTAKADGASYNADAIKFASQSCVEKIVEESPILFLRGDANHDKKVDLSDAITILNYLFNGGLLSCQDSADANDDGRIDISDAIRILNFLFQGGERIATPYPEAGIDSTEDKLSCSL